jgi:undecaprenyl-diphosphatase
MVALVAASRMYLGVHYFSDVLGGFLLASAWVALVVGVSPSGAQVPGSAISS